LVSKIKQLEDTEKSLHQSDESDGEENPDLEGRSAGEITEKSLHHTDESDGEENPDFEERSAEEIECVPQDSEIGDEEKSGSEDKEEADESRSALKEGANEDDKSDSEGSQASRSISRKRSKPRRESSSPSDVRDAEISDDEPLVFTSTLGF
jgi:hypothetical protein